MNAREARESGLWLNACVAPGREVAAPLDDTVEFFKLVRDKLSSQGKQELVAFLRVLEGRRGGSLDLG